VPSFYVSPDCGYILWCIKVGHDNEKSRIGHKRIEKNNKNEEFRVS
jgi:hypothetical protein